MAMSVFSRNVGSLLLSSVAMMLPAATVAEEIPVWFGTYTRDTGSEGIYVARFDTATGRLSEPMLAAKVVNPSFLARHPARPLLYAVSEIADLEGKPTGGVTAFAIDLPSGMLQSINAQPSLGGGPCQVSVDPAGRCVVAANYGGGSTVCLGIRDDGGLAPSVEGTPGGFIQHAGSSVNATRQEGPHAHCARTSKDGRFVLVPDLGIDRVLVHSLDSTAATIRPHAEGVVEPGSGPRHVALSPGGTRVYAINELALTVTGFAFDLEKGTLEPFQTISTIPDDVADREGLSTAEVVMHPSGRFLYGSNRGHHSIAMFRVDEEDGRLAFLGVEPIRGKTPRNFNVSPDGRWLLAAGQDSDTVSVFEIDSHTGRLDYTGQTVSVPKPVCVCF